MRRPSSRPSPLPVERSSSARRPSPWPCPGFLVFPIYFLRSVGIAASASSSCRRSARSSVLPAMLALLGKRIESLRSSAGRAPPSADSAFWRRCAEAVIRAPAAVRAASDRGAAGLGIPFLSVQFATPDERALPSDSNARVWWPNRCSTDYPLDTSQAVTLLTRNDDPTRSTTLPPGVADGRCGPRRCADRHLRARQAHRRPNPPERK